MGSNTPAFEEKCSRSASLCLRGHCRQRPQPPWPQDLFPEDNLPADRGWGQGFQDGSGALRLLCASLLLLLYCDIR